MSLSLAKKSLAMIDRDHCETKKDKKRNRNKLTDLIPENKRSMQIIGKKGSKKIINDLNSSKKLTVSAVKKNLNKTDNAAIDEKVRKLLLLSSSSLEEKPAKLMIERAQKGSYVVDRPEEDPDKGKSVFTEKDFLNFEKELFCRS